MAYGWNSATFLLAERAPEPATRLAPAVLVAVLCMPLPESCAFCCDCLDAAWLAAPLPFFGGVINALPLLNGFCPNSVGSQKLLTP